ncbi:MAG: YaeQ family protein [Pseudomonadota bacterium]
MALKATIFKVEMLISDLDRDYYHTHHLTVARHPSESDERMMVRLLAFALNADEQLQFTKGLSTEDEPDLWKKDLAGEIRLWIDVGAPDERRIRKACNRSDRVLICSYGRRSSVWWNQIKNKLGRFENLTVINIPKQTTNALADMVERTMQLHCTIEDGLNWLSDNARSLQIEPEIWLDTNQ